MPIWAVFMAAYFGWFLIDVTRRGLTFDIAAFLIYKLYARLAVATVVTLVYWGITG